MSIFENIKAFFSLAKQTNYDLSQIYAQEPNTLYIVVLILVCILFIIWFLINRSIKTSSAVKLASKIQDTKDINEFDTKLTKLVTELPKRGLKVANSINVQKNEILNQELALLKDLKIEDKISRYRQISQQYKLMAENSKKYSIEELTSFYEEKSKALLDENLESEIKNYYKNANFDSEDTSFINSVVSYANTKQNPAEVLNPLQNELDKFSYGYNLPFYKFVKSLDKQKAGQVYENTNKKLDELFSSGNGKVSSVVLKYMLENEQKEKVLKYISTLDDKLHLKNLYNKLFAKTDDMDLNLAFVANETQIEQNYKEYLDDKLTENWKDLAFIEKVINSKGVLQAIGHIDYRNVLERVEKLQTQDENNKAVAQALELAREAQSIAKEAKAIARSSK